MKLNLLYEGKHIQLSDDANKFIEESMFKLKKIIFRDKEEAAKVLSKYAKDDDELSYLVNERGFWTFGEFVHSRYVDFGKYGNKFVIVEISPVRFKVDDDEIQAGEHLSAGAGRYFDNKMRNYVNKITVFVDPNKEKIGDFDRTLKTTLIHEMVHVADPKRELQSYIHPWRNKPRKTEELVARLERLKVLLDKGMIKQDEYDATKKKILYMIYWSKPVEIDAYITQLANLYIDDGIEFLMRGGYSYDEAIEALRNRNLLNPRFKAFKWSNKIFFWKEHKPKIYKKFLRALYDIIGQK